ncbi:stage II sporulation protein P [Clostridium chauvoei]|uniref:Stage II sporulation protein P n=2 Tax=Clostridium chauvoei TaxID=46867 RepID=A0ABD4RG49_9CLOT|nr:stage II sporulation protein P [Clostridium chauvoei]ATD56196.1 stage II sporulation protein P [Clostridium chauvoei]ATD58707.1 stage II sporulation protein P [Clostridium chauvoei]MBX7279982.1 stage II sporulation protein P [Clostridium chauvoei]MBX7282359.1 stage II sporulation protein P [Clostridium chauvoei]MBX7284873.1 stage II sporulation protein P [Clostridium chauvoei]
MGRRGRVNSKGNTKFSMGYILMIIAILVFFIRALSVVDSYYERGGYAYVQLLNFGMPVVKTQVYNKGDFVENRLSVEKIIIQALGLGNINTSAIVGKELSLFKGVVGDCTPDKSLARLKPFSLNDNSIAKLSPEEIAELNKVSDAYDPTLKKALDNSKPEVLIYHTHTMEYYAEAGKETTDSNFNVVGVGDILAKELEEGYGISVIHDKTNHSLEYNDSYLRSEETLKSYLNKYGDFKLVIDLHRDSLDPGKRVTGELNGQELAKFMFVRTENSPRYAANEALTDKLYGISTSLYPEITRKIMTYEIGKNAFNQGLSDNSILIEVGFNTNTAQEAKLTAKYIARVLAEHLNRQ